MKKSISAAMRARRIVARSTPEYKEAAAARSRAWYAANKDRARERAKNAWASRSEADKAAHKEKQSEYHEVNKHKQVARKKHRRAIDPVYAEKVRTWKRARLPKPTRPCPALCEVCAALPGKKSLALDHCHVKNTFRGWLCSACNTSAGLLKDSPVLARKLASYLEQHS